MAATSRPAPVLRPRRSDDDEEGEEAGDREEGEYRQSHSLPTFAARIVTSSLRGLSPTKE